MDLWGIELFSGFIYWQKGVSGQKLNVAAARIASKSANVARVKVASCKCNIRYMCFTLSYELMAKIYQYSVGWSQPEKQNSYKESQNLTAWVLLTIVLCVFTTNR